MILNYTSTTEQTSGANIISAWIAILQKNSKSTAQLQSEMIEGVSQTIKDIQDKAIEKAKESLKETDEEDSNTDTEEYAVQNDTAQSTETVSDNTQSTIDIKV